MRRLLIVVALLSFGVTAASAQYGGGYGRDPDNVYGRPYDEGPRPLPQRPDYDRPPPPRTGYGPPPPPPDYGYRPRLRRCFIERTPYGPREVCRRGPPRW